MSGASTIASRGPSAAGGNATSNGSAYPFTFPASSSVTHIPTIFPPLAVASPSPTAASSRRSNRISYQSDACVGENTSPDAAPGTFFVTPSGPSARNSTPRPAFPSAPRGENTISASTPSRSRGAFHRGFTPPLSRADR